MSDQVRVLVADASAADRERLAALVRAEGYDTRCVEDGESAIREYERWAPDVVILDALLPLRSGLDVARHVKRSPTRTFTPLMFVTSLGDAHDLARCLEAGGDDFVRKPYDRVLLRARLNALVRMRKVIAAHDAHLVQEQEAAKAVFDNITDTGGLASPNVKSLVSPLSVFNGDALLVARNPSGGMHVLVGDFTGHGLAAAIGAMPLAEIFHGMTRKGFLIREIISECNRKLRSVLPPGVFCCVTIVDVNFQKRTAEYWNGGLPGGCLVRAADHSVEVLESDHLPLGILDPDRFDDQTRTASMALGDRLVLCTDGVIEARNRAGEMLGIDALHDLIRGNRNLEDLFDHLKGAIHEHLGGASGDDDVTLVEVAMVEESSLPSVVEQSSSVTGHPEDWRLTYQLGPRSLKLLNPLPLLQHILMEMPQLRAHSVALYTILSELYSNALEHGLLRLDSSLKFSADGFAEYYERRALALERLEGFVRFEFRCDSDGRNGRLVIRVVDSGQGFDLESLGALSGQDNYHGRGIAILQNLCSSVVYEGCGNAVEARFDW